jgi:hypothetical protein
MSFYLFIASGLYSYASFLVPLGDMRGVHKNLLRMLVQIVFISETTFINFKNIFFGCKAELHIEAYWARASHPCRD